LAGADALGALRQRLAGIEVLEQAERVFHVDAHRDGQPAHGHWMWHRPDIGR
jgi:hypothetical protein